ncbi:MAG: ribosome biogenesis GTPase YlqF [Lachnospiraceae bacterium]|nr:ribosome biogenesis GTPase YlqF [Lachnospiraceae bacterium]
MNFQWYPGHMTKAKRMMQEDIKLIDLVIELLDARVPLASRNPDIDEIAGSKSRLILLNKSDMADSSVTDEWYKYFTDQGLYVCKVNSRNAADMKQISAIVQQACAAKIERDKKRGIRNRPVRAMVVGIPNVGKSTFINTYARKAAAKTGNKPGVTKGKQWIKLGSNLELLDTPGILWPKFEDQSVGLKLALIGSIKDEIMNIEELSLELIKMLQERYPGMLEKYYEAGIEETDSALVILEKIARARGCIKAGAELDYLKAANLILENYRNGKIGKISLEGPNG